MESNNSVGKEEQACVNPIEDQRKAALEHYNDLATRCSHWSGFVEAAIKAYNPIQSSPTVDKEAILLKVANDHSYDTWGEAMYDTHEHTQIEYACEAMESYSSLQNSELRKEIQHLKQSILTGLKKEGELISSNEEKDKQIERLKKQQSEDLESMVEINKEKNKYKKEIEYWKQLAEAANAYIGCIEKNINYHIEKNKYHRLKNHNQ